MGATGFEPVTSSLSIWLVSLPWTEGRNTKIADNIITRGWADPQNYRCLTESEPLVPGQFYEMTFDLQPDDQVIPVGQQIAVMIFSSDRDFTLWPEPGTELTIDLDATTLKLPVVGGAEAFTKAIQQQADECESREPTKAIQEQAGECESREPTKAIQEQAGECESREPTKASG